MSPTKKDDDLKSSKKTVTPKLVYKLQLSAIPSISGKSADAIIEKYPSFNDLYKSLHSLTEIDRLKELKNIKYQTGKLPEIFLQDDFYPSKQQRYL